MASELTNDEVRRFAPYQLFMLVLCLWALLSLGATTFWPVDRDTRTILTYADTSVCMIFLVDFLRNLYKAPSKWGYLASWGWIDLLSSIPTGDLLRWGRAARAIRILRVLRAVKSARAVARFLNEQRAQSAFFATLLLAIFLLVFASVAVLQFEDVEGANIHTAEDALWWAISTMTTVGYGDTYPTTTEGRFVAVFLMAGGVSLFGTFSGLVATWFLSPAATETESEVHQLKAILEDIQRRLKDQQDRA